MKITLKKDVLTPENGVGRAGQTIEVSQAVGHEYIGAGLAEEADAATEALAKGEDGQAKHNAEAAKRKKKPATGPTETK